MSEQRGQLGRAAGPTEVVESPPGPGVSWRLHGEMASELLKGGTGTALGWCLCWGGLRAVLGHCWVTYRVTLGQYCGSITVVLSWHLSIVRVAPGWHWGDTGLRAGQHRHGFGVAPGHRGAVARWLWWHTEHGACAGLIPRGGDKWEVTRVCVDGYLR